VARSQATSASNAGGGDPGSLSTLSKSGSLPSAPLMSCSILLHVSASRKLTGEPDPWLMFPAPRLNCSWASAQDSVHFSSPSALGDVSTGWAASRRS